VEVFHQCFIWDKFQREPERRIFISLLVHKIRQDKCSLHLEYILPRRDAAECMNEFTCPYEEETESESAAVILTEILAITASQLAD
jgi:hypothetical protein